MARKPNPGIAELGPISDAIRKMGDERRAARDAITVDETQYQAGRERADVVEKHCQIAGDRYVREEYFAMTLNRPLRTDSSWFIRGYWSRVAEILSDTPENFLRG